MTTTLRSGITALMSNDQSFDTVSYFEKLNEVLLVANLTPVKVGEVIAIEQQENSIYIQTKWVNGERNGIHHNYVPVFMIDAPDPISAAICRLEYQMEHIKQQLSDIRDGKYAL